MTAIVHQAHGLNETPEDAVNDEYQTERY